MLDLDTFLTTVYVFVDDAVKHLPPRQRHPGPQGKLRESEVVTLAMLSQWKRFTSQRLFARFAKRNLRSAFPHLPNRSQLNRARSAAHDTIVAVGQALVHALGGTYRLVGRPTNRYVPRRQ